MQEKRFRDMNLEGTVFEAIVNARKSCAEIGKYASSSQDNEASEHYCRAARSLYELLHAAALNNGLSDNALVMEAHESYKMLGYKLKYEEDKPSYDLQASIYMKAICLLGEALVRMDNSDLKNKKIGGKR